jgi:hypothetical protein
MANINVPSSRQTDFPYCPLGPDGPGQQATGILTKLQSRCLTCLHARFFIISKASNLTPKELITSLKSYKNKVPNMIRHRVYFTCHNISDTLFRTLLLLLSSINIETWTQRDVLRFRKQDFLRREQVKRLSRPLITGNVAKCRVSITLNVKLL